MRIRAAWWWIPATVTIAGLVYLGLVKISMWQAARNEPAVVRETPRLFTPPPPVVLRQPVLAEEAPVPEVAPAPVRSPALPGLELPPYRPGPKR